MKKSKSKQTEATRRAQARYRRKKLLAVMQTGDPDAEAKGLSNVSLGQLTFSVQAGKQAIAQHGYAHVLEQTRRALLYEALLDMYHLGGLSITNHSNRDSGIEERSKWLSFIRSELATIRLISDMAIEERLASKNEKSVDEIVQYNDNLFAEAERVLAEVRNRNMEEQEDEGTETIS